MAFSTTKPVNSPDDVSLLNHIHNFGVYSIGKGPGGSLSVALDGPGIYSGIVLAQWHRAADTKKGFSIESLSVNINGSNVGTIKGGWGKTGDTGHGYDFLCMGAFGFNSLYMGGSSASISVGSSGNCSVSQVIAFLSKLS